MQHVLSIFRPKTHLILKHRSCTYQLQHRIRWLGVLDYFHSILGPRFRQLAVEKYAVLSIYSTSHARIWSPKVDFLTHLDEHKHCMKGGYLFYHNSNGKLAKRLQYHVSVESITYHTLPTFTRQSRCLASFGNILKLMIMLLHCI